jgi:hypothetical protein
MVISFYPNTRAPAGAKGVFSQKAWIMYVGFESVREYYTEFARRETMFWCANEFVPSVS